MSRLLDFKQFIGGADNVIVQEMLQEQQRTYTYNFDTNVTGWTYTANYSVIVLDVLTYDRATGLPNFESSNVIGYLGNTSTTINSATNIVVTDAVAGTVNFTIPSNRYSGWIYPDARANVVMSVVEFAWTNTTTTPTTTDSHRYGIIERYTADAVPGNPTTTGVGGNTVTFTDITGA
tara:strand:- start:992 stop:1522 length:531 start_codon:yes stop_codon:yes gene_type:complete